MNQLYDKEAEDSSQDLVCLKKWEFPGKISEKMPVPVSGIQLELPADIMEMSLERQEAYYPYRCRPEVILADEEEHIQITLQVTDQGLKPEETLPAAKQISKLVRRDFPGYRQSPVYLYRGEQMTIGWFIMEMQEREWEHVKAVFSINKKMVLLTFTYHLNEKEKWRVLRKHILTTIRETEGSRYGSIGKGINR